MDNTDLKVLDFGEKSLIKIIIKKTEEFHKTPILLGDDASVLDINFDKDIVASTDMLIQSKHFPKEMSYFQMGFKSVTVNVSDLAAMGSKPLGFLLNIAIYKNMSVKHFNEIIDGVLSACEFYNIPLVGGDTNEADEIIISGTALGIVEKDIFIKKSGFKVGDLLCITGDLGLAALGFEILSKDFNDEFSKIAISKILKPIARINEGMVLNKFSASSATDITDGLASELYEIYNEENKISDSNKGIIVCEKNLNISDEFKNLAKSLNKNYLDLILNFGEDFELLFTIAPDKISKLKRLMDFHIIGEINDSGKIEIKRENGSIHEILFKGYEHFTL